MKTILLLVMLVLLSACAHSGVSPPATIDTPVMAAPILFYRAFLSGADGHRCPMTPSCSSYAITAMRRHGALMGWIMATDRLMRCGRDELQHSPKVATRDGWRFKDPLENNDFWLR